MTPMAQRVGERKTMKKALLMWVVAQLAQPAFCGVQDHDVVIATTLTAVRGTPDAFKNVAVHFTVQFNQLGKISNPFFTRFVPNDFVNFYGWPSEQPIWRKDVYDDVFGLLFLSKEHKQLTDLYKLKTYDRVDVTGVVRNVFQGAPWVEVTKESLPENYNSNSELKFEIKPGANEKNWALTRKSAKPN